MTKLLSPLKELEESKRSLVSAFKAGAISHIFPESHTEIIDHYLRRARQKSEVSNYLVRKKIPFALIATGGYGRKELCLHSDIDIMVLFNKKIPSEAKDLTEEIIFPLWDLGFDLGYGTRSIKDCLSLSNSDFKVLTSMMDSRFICGDFSLYILLSKMIQKKIITKKAPNLKKWLEDLDSVRMDTFGDASYLLEPNLKEGIGGLRDYHHMLWLSRAFFQLKSPGDLEQKGKLSHHEYQELEKRLKFIRLVRNHLHQLSGRKNDCLEFAYQERIAWALQFRDNKNFLAVEQFMGRLHSYMATVKFLHQSFLLSNFPENNKMKVDPASLNIPNGFLFNNGTIDFPSAESIPYRPFLMMEAFGLSAKLGCPLSREARRLIKEFLPLVDDNFRKSKQANNTFINIINEPVDSFEALNQMMETGFLDAFIPEFGKIKDHVQFDSYHIYPVGRHSLQTVKYLKGLATEKDSLLRNMFRDISHPGQLYMAGLFHDIGKFTKEHALKGEKISQKILERMGFSGEEKENISRLVRHHLFLVETATRRDLNDEKLVIQCARVIDTPKHLKMLYLLTWADSRATGPKAWNAWIASLVRELFFKILHILEKGELATSDTSLKVKQVKNEMFRTISPHIDRDTINVYLEAMSPRYLLNTSPQTIARHVEILQSIKQKQGDTAAGGKTGSSPGNFILEAKKGEEGDFWEVTFLSRDKPGLFSKITGVMAINNINILSAEIYTWQNQTTVDIFRVTNPPDTILIEKAWKKVEKDLQNALNGKLSLEFRLGQKSAPSLLSHSKKTYHRPKVIIDNDASDFFTIIEVFADDQAGLLFQITRTLSDFQLDIHIAKISTKADQIADTFYVRDLGGQKAEDQEQIDEIKRALIFKLEKR